MNHKVCYASVAGPANRELGVNKQDATMIRKMPSGVLLVVCDGLGSRPKSELGARQACCAAKDSAAYLGTAINAHNLCESVHSNWLQLIAPETADDAATTCLLAHVSTEGNVILAQLGDGLILCRSNGRFTNITPERRLFSDQTFALSTKFNFSDWVVHESTLVEPGDGVVMMTDGISEDIDHNRLDAFFEEIRFQTFKMKTIQMRRWLTQQLNEWPTPGHSDDKSLAALFKGYDNDCSN